MSKRVSYKHLYEEASRQLAAAEGDVKHWRIRADVAEQEVNEIGRKLDEAIQTNYRLTADLRDAQAQLPSGTLGVAYENMRRINNAMKGELFKDDDGFWRRLSIWFRLWKAKFNKNP